MSSTGQAYAVPPRDQSDGRLSRWVSTQRGMFALRFPGTPWSARIHIRTVVVTLWLVAATVVVFCWSLAVGDFSIPVGDVVANLLGSGENDFIIRRLRLPRSLTAVMAGAAFGVSGAILQRLARNPLASPDIIGINAGAAAAAVWVLLMWDWAGTQVALGAVAGALATATAVYLLAYRRGIVTAYRLVLVGIGLTAALQAVTRYLVTKVELYDAQRAMVWLTGSLHNRGWDHVRHLGWALVVLVPATLWLARHLRALELGDDAAHGLGTRVERARQGLLLVAVALAAAATAATGPITFVALASPQIARRLVGGRSLALVPAAACGALLLLAADLLARRVVAPSELPVGVMTGILGAPYLLYLLSRANRIT